MDVKLDTHINPVGRNSTVQRRPRKPAPASDTVQLDQTANLKRSLASTPEVRAAAVERARSLIADPNYPPKETVLQMASLLAARMTPGRD